MKNKEIAEMFETMADVMEIQGENSFRINSYRKVASTLQDMGEAIEDVAASGKIENIEGVGKSSAEKITEYLKTGHISAYDKLLKSFPVEALELLRIPEVGPKTVARLMNEKKINSVASLENAIENGLLEGMEGIGEKTIEKMKKGIAFLKSFKGRTLLGDALPAAAEIIADLLKHSNAEKIETAGSLRRMRETVGDIDILASTPHKTNGEKVNQKAAGRDIINAFSELDTVAEVLARGDTKGSIRTKDGLQIDLRAVPGESFGAALLYFTGSKAHNVKLRGIALDRGLKINEYGVFRGPEQIAGETEESVYRALDLPVIPPELREDRGEVEAATDGKLPELIELEDIRGDLHAHSNFSDGNMPLKKMAQLAAGKGYEYVAITDHSKNLTVAGGLDEKELEERNKLIDKVNAEMDGGLIVLKGTEVDILKDGSLDYPDVVLEKLDWVIASVHDHFGMNERQMTERILAAVRNPHVHCIGHLTGRLLNRREPYKLNTARIIKECSKHGTALELNAHPDRLDINDVLCREAKKAGVKVAIGTDAHTGGHYELMRFGTATARRGGLEPGDVLNSFAVSGLF